MPIKIEYLSLIKLTKKYIKKKGKQDVYDLRRAWKEEPLIQELFPYGDAADRIDLAKLINKLKKAVKKGYLEIIEPEDHPEGYVKSEKILDKIGGKRGFNNLCREMRDLIEAGEELKDHSRRIQRYYHLSKDEVEGIWSWISKEYEGMTQEETSQLKEVRKVFNEQKSLVDIKMKKNR